MFFGEIIFLNMFFCFVVKANLKKQNPDFFLLVYSSGVSSSTLHSSGKMSSLLTQHAISWGSFILPLSSYSLCGVAIIQRFSQILYMWWTHLHTHNVEWLLYKYCWCGGHYISILYECWPLYLFSR